MTTRGLGVLRQKLFHIPAPKGRWREVEDDEDKARHLAAALEKELTLRPPPLPWDKA
jgi:hypothetical protein